MTTIRQFSRIALGMLTMTGRVTMLGISRWTADGGSYRTVQRFFTTLISWATRQIAPTDVSGAGRALRHRGRAADGACVQVAPH